MGQRARFFPIVVISVFATACGGDDGGGGGGTIDAAPQTFDSAPAIDAAVAPVVLTGTIGGDSVAGFDSAAILTAEGTEVGIAIGTGVDCATLFAEPGLEFVLLVGRCDGTAYSVDGTLSVDPNMCEDLETGAFGLVERDGSDSEEASGGSVVVAVDGTEVSTTLNLQFETETVTGTVRTSTRCAFPDE